MVSRSGPPHRVLGFLIKVRRFLKIMVIGCNCRSGWLEVVIAFKSVNAHNTNSPRRGKIIQGKEIINDTKI